GARNDALSLSRRQFHVEPGKRELALLAEDPSLKRFKSHKPNVRRLMRVGDVLTIVVVAGLKRWRLNMASAVCFGVIQVECEECEDYLIRKLPNSLGHEIGSCWRIYLQNHRLFDAISPNPIPYDFHPEGIHGGRFAQKSRQTAPIKAPVVAGKDGGEPPATGSEKPPPPPPPEKPLPGDCCGSGCVRCVWDIYYDELEDYNKLYKTDSKPS
ncbi:hypothetical protein F8388_009875, partial [Cannabis sativa]